MVMIRDLDMIKDITVKDFDCFLNHRVFVSEDIDFVGKALFFLKGDNKLTYGLFCNSS